MWNKTICSTAEAMQVLYDTTHSFGISKSIILEHAAIACMNEIKKRIKDKQSLAIFYSCDQHYNCGLALARCLYQEGYAIHLILIHPEKKSPYEIEQWNILKHFPISIHTSPDSIPEASGIIVCSPNLSPIWTDFIQASHAYIISLNIPAGADETTGQITEHTLHSDLVISLDCYKYGQWIEPARSTYKDIVCVNIGIPQTLHKTHTIFLNQEYIRAHLPKRTNRSHKGSFKKALMIGGSSAMHGAITMAAKACYSSGIGTLTLAIPQCISTLVAYECEFAMNLLAEDTNGFFSTESIEYIKEQISSFDLISVGNGMGRNETTKEIVKNCLLSNKLILIDADGLWALQDNLSLLNRNQTTILTPHIKEMCYLCHKEVQEIIKNPFETVRTFTQQYPHCILVLKSDITWISTNTQSFMLSKSNSALAKGGSGDILCGIIMGLLGQTSPTNAVVCATYIHNLCAQLTKKDPAAVLPQDLIDTISDSFKILRKS